MGILCSNMKAIIVTFPVAFLATMTLALVPKYQAVDECANCETNLTTMANFLASDMVIKATVTSFKNDLCPYSGQDTEACQKNVTALWPAMANTLFKKNMDGAATVCTVMKKCNQTITLDVPMLRNNTPACDTCIHLVQEISTAFQMNETLLAATGFLNGNDFCSGSVKPPTLTTADCQGFNKWFTPAAMTHLGKVIHLSSETLCQQVYGDCK